MSKLNEQLKQKGAATILLVMFLMNVILLIALTTATIIIYEVKMVSELANSIPAFYAADAAAEKCLYQARRLSDDLECNQLSGGTSVMLDNGATATASRQDNKINTSGVFGQTKRSVEVEWE